MGARLTEKKVGRETMRGAGHCDRMYDGGWGMVVMMCFAMMCFAMMCFAMMCFAMMCFPQHSCCGKDLMLAVSFV